MSDKGINRDGRRAAVTPRVMRRGRAADAQGRRSTETSAFRTSDLTAGRLDRLCGRPEVIDYGAIVLCTSGTAVIEIDFREWRLAAGAVMTLFPDDVVMLRAVSDDFGAEMLSYDRSILREASLHIEQAVYSQLRSDRCRTNSLLVTRIVRGMFGLLHIYMEDNQPECFNEIVLYQLKSFFLGFYDYVNRAETSVGGRASGRSDELFNMFMKKLETDHMRAHDVAYYAAALNITPKYLNNIVRRVTRHSTKEIIDNYVIQEIKRCLRSADLSVKQTAWRFNFSDTAFFCRYFKQHVGITPQQFRRAAPLSDTSQTTL